MTFPQYVLALGIMLGSLLLPAASFYAALRFSTGRQISVPCHREL